MTAGVTDVAQPVTRRPRSVPLASRLMLASILLAIVVAAVFTALIFAVATLKRATDQEARAKDVTASTLQLEKLVLDLETGIRGYALTDNKNFLETYTAARAAMPNQIATFEQLASSEGTEALPARRIATNIQSYVNDYAAPLLSFAREVPDAARTPEAISEDKRRIDQIRTDLKHFLLAEDALTAEKADTAAARANRAIAISLAAVVLSAALIVLFGVYLARSIGRPVRDAADGATRLAAGDLKVRLAEKGPGEVGELTRAFNAMAGDLDRSRAELERRNARLRESERLKSELVSIVSHEVRTPLASVLGFTSLLLNRDSDPDTRRRYLEIVDAQGRRLASLLDDFLDVQRIEEGRLELVPKLVDLSPLLGEQVQLFSALSERHHLLLTLRDEPLQVRGDPDRLAQVLGNLLSNAIKYSPDGGVVEVIGERDGDGVRVSVRDEGVGIPAGQQKRIFTKFFRGDAATSGIAGSGLGLAFARAVVEAHGGRMAFESNEGEGSVFSLELPAARA